MSVTMAIMQRELKGYFSTPLAYVVIVIFLFMVGLFTFTTQFFEANMASMSSFFAWHPIFYCLLAAAVSMRLWAEERKSGTVELLFTLPVTPAQAIVGKFAAAWAFLGIALLLTAPAAMSICYLGDPDNGTIIGGYLGSFLMLGSFLAIGACMSALTRSQVIAFILGVLICILLLLAGHPLVQTYFSQNFPVWVGDAVASVSAQTHFTEMERGEVSLANIFYFVSMIIGWLMACGVILEQKKAE
ncbi:ABC transporter permease subunit [Candidatus Sumerlaeota bacterium]|nr:ABC transporter permease subunit [Candidatus Sumerlaeota bacterium]